MRNYLRVFLGSAIGAIVFYAVASYFMAEVPNGPLAIFNGGIWGLLTAFMFVNHRVVIGRVKKMLSFITSRMTSYNLCIWYILPLIVAIICLPLLSVRLVEMAVDTESAPGFIYSFLYEITGVTALALLAVWFIWRGLITNENDYRVRGSSSVFRSRHWTWGRFHLVLLSIVIFHPVIIVITMAALYLAAILLLQWLGLCAIFLVFMLAGKKEFLGVAQGVIVGFITAYWYYGWTAPDWALFFRALAVAGFVGGIVGGLAHYLAKTSAFRFTNKLIFNLPSLVFDGKRSI